MLHYTDLTGLASVAVAATAATLLLPSVARLTPQRLAVLQGLVFVLILVPLGDLSLAAYLRGATGDLSITTLALLMMCGIGRITSSSLDKGRPGGVAFKQCFTSQHNRSALLMFIALAALALYPLALGISSFDPYRLGYGNPWLVFAFLLIALLAWLRKFDLIAVCIAFATLAWAVGWYESDNLWDYLLDPFVSIYALSAVISRTFKLLFKRV